MSVGMQPEEFNKLNNIRNEDSSYEFESDSVSSKKSSEMDEDSTL